LLKRIIRGWLLKREEWLREVVTVAGVVNEGFV
jgi:hypothetical protein